MFFPRDLELRLQRSLGNLFDVDVDSFPEVTAILDDGSTVEDRQKEIRSLMSKLVCPELKRYTEMCDLIADYYDVFIQSNFDGVNGVEPIHTETTPDMPKEIRPYAQRIPRAVNDAFVKGGKRLKQTLWTTCESTTVASIVIAAKATEPFIRMGGNYVKVNKYILKLHWPIPIVRDSLELIVVLRSGYHELVPSTPH